MQAAMTDWKYSFQPIAVVRLQAFIPNQTPLWLRQMQPPVLLSLMILNGEAKQ
ncbi:hypothetical protein D3C86_1942310 [compost metagenome]